jgi:Phosphatidylserine/phosphatidylglycerophosphate/cardiolipin synthases and related enzymes
MLVYYLNELSVMVYLITMLLGAVVGIIILADNGNPSFKIPWIILIIMFPLFGVMLYILNSKIWGRKEFNETKFISEMYLDQDDEITKELGKHNKMVLGHAKYIFDNAGYPCHVNTDALYFPLGEDLFEDLLVELKNAKKFIFMEFFIVQKGYMWDTILDILLKKVDEGVEVRFMYDDIGCIWKLPNNYYKELKKLGIKSLVFNRFIPVLSIVHNNRDHRKVVVIDGDVGYTGGINLADEYININSPFGHWKDTGIKIKGDAVKNLTMIFLDAWNTIKAEDIDYDNYLPTIKNVKSDGYFIPFDDNPMKPDQIGENVYLNIINSAVDYVYITSPYLIITHELITALVSAAKRGVDVKIITPAIPDKWIIHAMTQSYYPVLMDAGIEIYEYTPGFIHSKVFVSDDVVSVVGTINLDYRSLYHHYENAIWIYSSEVIKNIKEDFIKTKNRCDLMDIEKHKKLPWYKRLVGAVAKIFAPLM